jgi:hypothetical protein
MTKRDPLDDLIKKLEKLPLPMAPDPFDPFKFDNDLTEKERQAEKAAKAAQQPPTP